MRLLPLLILLLTATTSAHQIEVLHWWTTGSEAKAAQVMRSHWLALGNQWQDSAIAGGGGKSAMLVLRSRVLAGTPPQAAHLKGAELHAWAQLGFMRDLGKQARRDQWDLRLYPFVSSTLNHQGHPVGLPIGIHRMNWLWANPAVFTRLQLEPPHSWEAFITVANQLKQAGITPLAIGDEPWQLAILFESIALGEGGSDFFRRAFVNLDDETLRGTKMQAVLRRFHQLRAFLPANHIGLKWHDATRMVLTGQAAMQIMGDWVKSEEGAPGLRCLPAPGTAGKFSYNLDSLGLFVQTSAAQSQAQDALTDLIMDSEFQREFNREKGSIPTQPGIELTGFDPCAIESVHALQLAIRQGDLVPSMAEGMAIPPYTQQAIFDLLASYFSDPDGNAKQAAEQLARGVRAMQRSQNAE